MDYKDYQRARDSAWEILLDCNVEQLPVDVTSICQALGIRVFSYRSGEKMIARHGLQQLTEQTDGFAMMLYDVPVIFFDSRCTKQRARFTIAHEIGHIMLGHVGHGQCTRINREPAAGDAPEETQANQFAARLLAPACVLWALDIHTAEEIALLCDISLPAAGFRAQRMAVLYQRQKFLTSPLERQVHQAFLPFIRHQKNNRE